MINIQQNNCDQAQLENISKESRHMCTSHERVQTSNDKQLSPALAPIVKVGRHFLTNGVIQLLGRSRSMCVTNIWAAEILKLGKPCNSWWSWPSCTSHKEPRLLPRRPSKESDLVLNQNQIGYDDYAKDNLVHLVHGIDRDTLPKKFKPPGTSGCWLPRPVFSPLHCCPPGVCKIFLKLILCFSIKKEFMKIKILSIML